MKVVDARSGAELALGVRIDYPDGEWLKVVDVEGGLFSASAIVETMTRDPRSGVMVHMTQQVPLTVRWTHPRFFLQHVAFVNS